MLSVRDIDSVDISRIEQGLVTVSARGQRHDAYDFDAFEIVMLLQPSALEGRRLKWVKNAWAFHNLVAHPVMQIMVWLGFKKLAIRLHDATVPKPCGIRAS
ncbi:MAG: hypothetical protein EPN97_03050 [Alphaproteobacteria bacterium]|nr:MAG: hypothetical protein EPN97_03050 [Alphaproteobacteria bacterium]